MIPINLLTLVLNLSNTNMGVNADNIKYLAEGIDSLPYSLQ